MAAEMKSNGKNFLNIACVCVSGKDRGEERENFDKIFLETVFCVYVCTVATRAYKPSHPCWNVFLFSYLFLNIL